MNRESFRSGGSLRRISSVFFSSFSSPSSPGRFLVVSSSPSASYFHFLSRFSFSFFLFDLLLEKTLDSCRRVLPISHPTFWWMTSIPCMANALKPLKNFRFSFFFKVEPCSCISIQMCLYRLFVCLFFQFLCVFFVILFRFPPPVSDRWNDENYLASEAKKVQTTKWRPSFPSSRYFKKDITISDPYGVSMENSVIGPYLMSSWKKKSFEKK